MRPWSSLRGPRVTGIVRGARYGNCTRTVGRPNADDDVRVSRTHQNRPPGGDSCYHLPGSGAARTPVSQHDRLQATPRTWAARGCGRAMWRSSPTRPPPMFCSPGTTTGSVSQVSRRTRSRGPRSASPGRCTTKELYVAQAYQRPGLLGHARAAHAPVEAPGRPGLPGRRRYPSGASPVRRTAPWPPPTASRTRSASDIPECGVRATSHSACQALVG